MTAAELIAKLESASEGSEALDREIADFCGIKWSPDEDGNFGGYNLLPRRCWFTRLLDAGMTLVPADHMVYMTLNSKMPYCKPHWTCCAPPGLGGPTSASKRRHLESSANTPPLALCGSALKAREAAK